MRQHRHQKQQRQRLLDSLPAAPARLFIKQLLCLPLAKDEEGGQEVEGGEMSSNDPATATCRLVLGGRHVEEVRCLGMVVKHGEAGAGLWLDDGTGVVFVLSSPQPLLPPIGQLCEMVGAVKLCRIPLDKGQKQQQDQQRNEEVQQQPQSHELQRVIAAHYVFVPQDPNVETAFTLSTLELFRTVYVAQAPPQASHPTPYYAVANGPSPPPPAQSPSAPPSPSSSSSSSSSSTSTDGMVLSHILHLHANGEASNGVGVHALQGLASLTELELEASLSRLQMDGLVYCLQGSFYPL